MATRNVVLSEHQATLIAELILSGRHQNASEVLREGLRLLERRESEEAAKLEGLRRALDEPEAAVERGEVYDSTPALLQEIDDEREVVARRAEG